MSLKGELFMKKYNKLKFIPNIIFSVIMIILLSAEIGAQQIPAVKQQKATHQQVL